MQNKQVIDCLDDNIHDVCEFHCKNVKFILAILLDQLASDCRLLQFNVRILRFNALTVISERDQELDRLPIGQVFWYFEEEKSVHVPYGLFYIKTH